MRELETLVDGFKTDQKEIESVIVRTLHNLDELEESASTAAAPAAAGGIAVAASGGMPAAGASGATMVSASPSGKHAESRMGTGTVTPAASPQAVAAGQNDAEPPSPKEELDIF